MKMAWLKGLIAGAVFAAVAPFGLALALEIPAAPTLERPIVDQTGTLTEDQITTLSQQILQSRSVKDYEIGVWMFESLNGESITDVGIAAARKWGVGDKAKDNGILITVAKNDRKVRIDVGERLEPDLTDAEAGRIIRNTIAPQFKKDDFYSGISLGIQDIAAQVTGSPEKDSSARGDQAGEQGWGNFSGDLIFWAFIIGINVISWFFAIMARTKSWWLGGVMGGVIGLIVALVAAWALWAVITLVVATMVGFLFDWAVSRNFANSVHHGDNPNWWAGGPWIGGWGSGGGSGGGSFGGGSFGGGGADGSW